MKNLMIYNYFDFLNIPYNDNINQNISLIIAPLLKNPIADIKNIIDVHNVIIAY